MADVTLTATQLTAGTEGADLVGSGTAVNSGQTFEFDAGFNGNVVFVLEEVGGGAPTITFNAGVNPPSRQAIAGVDTVVLAAADLRLFVPIPSRHISASGYINGSVATANCRIRVYRLPAGFVAPKV